MRSAGARCGGGGRGALAIAALFALSLWLGGCTPSQVMRDGTQVPYEQAADADLQRAREAIDERRFTQAIALLDPFLTELRSSRRADEALFLLAEAHHRSNDTERSVLALRRLLDRHPRSRFAPKATLRAAERYRDLGRPEIGRRLLANAPFDRAPTELRASMHRLYADLARAEGEYGEAALALALSRRDTEDADELAALDMELGELIGDRLHDAELADLVGRLPRGPVFDRVVLELAGRQLGRGDFEAALDSLARLPQRLRPVDERIRDRLRKRALSGSQTAVYMIGLALPLSGPYAPFGASVLRGVVQALEVFNETPGRFHLALRDTHGLPEDAVLAVRELIDEDVRVIIGPMRSVSAAAAAPVANRAAVPLLTMASRRDVPFLGDYVFRLGLDTDAQVKALVDCAVGQLQARRLAVLYPRDAYGTAFKNAFWDEVERQGGEIVGVEGYDPHAVDMQTEIRKLVGLEYMIEEEIELVAERDRLSKRRAENAERLAELAELQDLPPHVDFDALFIPDAAAKAGLILPQLRFYDIRDVRSLGPHDWNNEALPRIAGRHARGSVFVDGFYAQSPDPRVSDFVAEFQGQFGVTPDSAAARGYDAARLVRTIIEASGHLSSRRLRDELLNVASFAGVSGLTAFDEVGGPRVRLQLLTVARGAIRSFDCVP